MSNFDQPRLLDPLVDKATAKLKRGSAKLLRGSGKRLKGFTEHAVAKIKARRARAGDKST